MKKVLDRIIQFLLYLVRPFLKWREPKILQTYDELAIILKEKNKHKVFLVIDHNLADLGLHNSLVSTLKRSGIKVDIFNDVSPNPTISQVEKALSSYLAFNGDTIVGFGGGSPLDVAKALGARVAKPHQSLVKMGGILKVNRKIPLLIAIPTTAGTGSEVTLASVIVDEKTKRKYAINDPVLIPSYTLLVPELTFGLTPFLTATTGLDALTHAVEAYTNWGGTRYTNRKAINAVSLIFKNIETVYLNPLDYEARKMMQIAAYDAGVAFTRNYVGYVHALSHPLSAFYNLPHGYVNAIIMPFMLEKYGVKICKKLATLAREADVIPSGLTDVDTANQFIEKIRELNSKFSLPSIIKEISINDIPTLAKFANKEARPLYPTPVLFATSELEKFYVQLKGVSHEK